MRRASSTRKPEDAEDEDDGGRFSQNALSECDPACSDGPKLAVVLSVLSSGKRWNLKRDGDKAALEPIFNRLAEDREHVKISKMFSYVLRHAAHKLDVRIRKDGFVRLRDIMELKNFRPYNLEELMACVYFDEKERYTMVREFDGELLIRANQGHTMKVVEDDLLLEIISDPSTVQDCVHGTYLVHWPFIKRQGLSKVARNHIHLAPGLPEDGKIRGMRSTAELFLYIDVPAAMQDGMVFYRSKNEVILTQGLGAFDPTRVAKTAEEVRLDGWLPVKYFIKAVKINYSTCDIEELEFDRGSQMPSWAAELAPSGPGEAGSYMVKNLEALIANCRKRMAEINELKAAAENGQSLTEEEQQKLDQYGAVYIELQSLEQRFRQHKGYRRESSTTFKATDKEKAESGWAAIGKRREHAAEHAAAKKESEKKARPSEWRRQHTVWHSEMRQTSTLSFAIRKVGREGPSCQAGNALRRMGKGFHTVRCACAKSHAFEVKVGASEGPPRFFNSKLQQQKEQKEKEKERETKEKEGRCGGAECETKSGWTQAGATAMQTGVAEWQSRESMCASASRQRQSGRSMLNAASEKADSK
ncbi:unnamed protein product [Effrenium voratum]|nr:unnamed protein product [Effrenium voratum]